MKSFTNTHSLLSAASAESTNTHKGGNHQEPGRWAQHLKFAQDFFLRKLADPTGAGGLGLKCANQPPTCTSPHLHLHNHLCSAGKT